jgi:hypothetical protein
LASGLDGVLVRRNLSWNSTLLTSTTKVVKTPQMVFTNSIMTTHVNRTTNRPLMNSMVAEGYKSVNATSLRNEYWESSVVTAQIVDHKDGHYVRPNKVVLKYLDFKKNVNPNVHVRMFNSVIKANAKTSEKYIINVFSYTKRYNIELMSKLHVKIP